MRKLQVMLGGLAVLAAVLTFGGGTTHAAVGGPICNVPADYPTIQLAVNDVGCTTIKVAPGVYNENVSIGRTLTLNGARAGQAVAGRTSGGPLESTVKGLNPIGANPVITINAAGVTVDGFTLKNAVTVGAAVGIDVKNPGNNAVIKHNIIDGITTSDTGGNGTAQAVYLERGPDNVLISGNELTNVQSARSAKGVLIGDNGGTDPSQNTVIRNNSISNITSGTRGAYGVSVANVLGVSGLQIRNNTIDKLNGGGWVHAIGLEGDTPGVAVTGNTISNLVSSTPNVIAVWFESEDVSFSSGQVHNNNFNIGSAAYGIAVDTALTGSPVNGACNWWGAANGPGPVGSGSGAKVSLNVAYKPWLTSPAPGGDCNGGVPADKEDCKNGGWQNLTDDQGRPFKNQGDCVSFVQHHQQGDDHGGDGTGGDHGDGGSGDGHGDGGGD